MNLKIICKTKDIINRTKQQPAGWEKNLANPTYERSLIQLKNETSKTKKNNPIKNLDESKRNSQQMNRKWLGNT